MRLRVVVQHTGGEAGQRAREHIQLGREQPARGGRGAQAQAAALLGHARGVPEQRAESREIEGLGARRAGCRQRALRGAPASRLNGAGGSPQPTAGARVNTPARRVRREGMEALDERERRRRAAVAGHGAPPGRRVAGRGLDLQLAATVTQAEHERRAGGREHAERAEQAAPRRARAAGPGMLGDASVASSCAARRSATP